MSFDSGARRKPLIVANWKMYKTVEETVDFFKAFLPGLPPQLDRDIAVCPPFVSLTAAATLIAKSPVALGAQNMNDNEQGAFTGEISGVMLKSAGCRYVIIGHSERRQIFGETDTMVNKKIKAAFKLGLVPIACVGETLKEREANQTQDVVSRQVKAALADLPSGETRALVIAYEPVWAIGTGKTATPGQAQDVHLMIRDILKDQYGSGTSLAVRILYGGSVKPENMADLMGCEDIDGGLVGGASLEAGSFLKIVNYQEKAPTQA